METRRRGREARGSTDQTRSTTSEQPDISPTPLNHSTIEPRSTRSRSRRASAPSPQSRPRRSIRISRNTRHSTSPNQPTIIPTQPSSSTHQQSVESQPSQSNTTPTTRRSFRPRRKAANLLSAVASVATPSSSSRAQPSSSVTRPSQSRNSNIRTPNTRKRTRASTRRNSIDNSVNPNSTPQASSSRPPTASISPSPSGPVRPSKKPRRGPQASRARSSAALAAAEASGLPFAAGLTFAQRRSRGMNSGNTPDGNDDRPSDRNVDRSNDDGPSSLGSDRNAPTTLQGLLRRLGADLSDIFPANGGASQARLHQLRASIVSPSSDEQQIQALSELCEILSIGTEESMVSFSVNIFVSPLVNLLRSESNVEIKILAARSLTHMMEALPSSSSTIAMNGAAAPLCQNLLSIEYIDLAEQSLSALHKLSIDYPQQIVSANGFQAVLSFIDFFSIGMQRVAASTACNLCRLPRADAMDMISGVLPTMMRLIDSDDQRIRESAVVGFTRLAEAFRASSEKLETLCGEDSELITKMIGLVVPSSPPALTTQSYSSALRLLAVLARGSAKLSLQILSTKSLILKLNERLSGGTHNHAVDCLLLADSLLLDIPELEINHGATTRSRRRRSFGSAAAFAAVDEQKREDLQKDTEPLQFFGRSLFTTLMTFYVSSAEANARRIVLSVLSKFIAMAPEPVLTEVIMHKSTSSSSSGDRLGTVRFCPFVASLLGENSSRSEVLIGLSMAAAALPKLPSLRESFIREGVLHEIVRLAALDTELPAEGEDQPAPNSSSDRNQNSGPSSGTAITRALEPPSTIESARRGPPTGLTAALQRAAAESGRGSTPGLATAIQRTTSHRGRRSEFAPFSHRAHSRPWMEVRLSNQSSRQNPIPVTARSILETHLGTKLDGKLEEEVLKDTTLGKLTDICAILSNVPSESKGEEALSELISLLLASDGLTVFEVSRSKAMEAVSKYLSPEEKDKAASRTAALVECLNKAKKSRGFLSLVELGLGVLAAEEKLTIHTNETSHGTTNNSVSSGLRQLAQPFRLRLKRAPLDEGGAELRDYSHHVVLIDSLATMATVQEFLWPKVRQSDRHLERAGSSGQRRSSHIGRRENIDEEDGGSELLNDGSPNADAENSGEDGEEEQFGVDDIFEMEEGHNEGDEIVEDDDEEQNSDHSDEEVSSGEEEVIERDGADSDDQGDDSPDALDVDQLTASLPPFELDHDALGHAPSRSAHTIQVPGSQGGHVGSSGSRTSNEFDRQDRTFRSYAAALAANIPRNVELRSAIGGASASRESGHVSRDSRSGRNQTVQKLVFSLNGKVLPHDCSILSAVIQSSAGEGSIGSRLWSEIHTLVYSKASVPDSSAPDSATPAIPVGTESTPISSRGASSTTTPLRRSQRLQEIKEKNANTSVEQKNEPLSALDANELETVTILDTNVLPPRTNKHSDFPPSIAAVIDVLTQLHWIRERSKNNIHCPPDTSNQFPQLIEESNAQFVSHKLSAKLMRQLSDPLALCGGAIPSWCFSIARDASFLVPFEIRRILFQSTSLGITRALHLLQVRTDLSGANNSSHRSSRSHRESEARISRIQRQKVRVHRNRILESAITTMNMYSAHGTVLEVEYFNEAGTGLGPTLEFYTLTSREIQRVDLKLWRGTGDSENEKKKDKGQGDTANPNERGGGANSGQTTVRRRSRRNSTTAALANNNDSNYVVEEPPAHVKPTGDGLYPLCLHLFESEPQREASKKSTALFTFIGRLLGKAMIDGRLLDLRFSSIFSKLLLSYCRVLNEQAGRVDSGQNNWSNANQSSSKAAMLQAIDRVDRAQVWSCFTDGTTAMKLLDVVDPGLAASLRKVLTMAETDRDGVSSLCLTYVLPGDDSVELIKKGSDVEVTGDNATDFVKRVVYHVLFGGVYQQAEALLRGLGELINITSLLTFKNNEIELLMCGPSFENWTVEFLVQATRCDHGYSHESPAVLTFLRILCEMTTEEQQQFVLFATGSPALPLGGLRNLNPRLTIVRRTPEGGRSPDECLPTVMTCTNYFKLPDYSSMDIARKQIMYAVREGQGSFHLS